MFLNLGNKTICYEVKGNKNNPCLILVSGITSQLINWPDALLDAFVDAGFYVVTFDNRDVGLSTYYDDLPTPDLNTVLAQLQQGQKPVVPYTYHDMAADIADLMAGLDIQQAHILGVSMGGQIAQVFALDYPEKLLSLTLVMTSSGDADLPPPKQEVLDFFFNSTTQVTDIETAIERHMAQNKIYEHPNDYNEEEANQRYEKAYHRAYHPQGNQRHLLALMTAMPRGELLPQLKMPVLIMHGDYDPVFSVEHAQRLHEKIPQSQLHIIPNLGHGLPARIFPMLVTELKSIA